MPAGRPSKYQPEFCELAETTLAKGYSLAVLAGECGVCIDTVMEWQKVHPEFSASVRVGRAKGARVWEDRLAALADKGAGNATGIIFGLKNRIPEEWKDVTRQEQTGVDGAPLEHVHRIERVIVDPKA
jgi:hypothetical protein